MGKYFTYKRIGFMNYIVYHTSNIDKIIAKCFTKKQAAKTVDVCKKAKSFSYEISFCVVEQESK